MIGIKFKVKNWKNRYIVDEEGFIDNEVFKCDKCGKTKYHLSENIYINFKKGYCEKCYKELIGGKNAK